MTPLRPKVFLDRLLQRTPLSLAKSSLAKSSFAKSTLLAPQFLRGDRLLQALLFSAVFLGVTQTKPSQAATFQWLTPATNNWTTNAGNDTAPQTFVLPSGVQLRITFSYAGGAQDGNQGDTSPRVDTTLLTGRGSNLFVSLGPESAPVPGDGIPPGAITLTAQFLNAAGQPVPVDALQYNVLDIDRDAAARWQDVVSFLASRQGTPVTPTVAGGPVTQVVNAPTGRAYSLPAGFTDGPGGNAVTLRGQEGAPNDGATGDATANHTQAVDQFSIIYGNGRQAAADNGGVELYTTTAPLNAVGAHAIGVLSNFQFNPGIIGIAKAATAATPDPARPGNFLTTFTFLVRNLGEVTLDNVQVVDNLATTFPAGFVIATPAAVTAQTGGATVAANPNFGTGGDTNLLAGGAGSVLPVGSSATFTVTVSFNPGAATTFNNQATTTGRTPGGGVTTDLSDNGTEVSTQTGTSDPTGPGQDDPTPISISLLPQIGITKQVLSTIPVAGQPGAYDVTFRQIIRNVSATNVTNDDLANVQLQETLNNTFRVGQPNGVGSTQVLSISSPAASPLAGVPGNYFQFQTTAPGSINPAQASNFITTTGNSLPNRQDYSVVDFVVRITPQPSVPIEGQPSFESQATTLGTPLTAPGGVPDTTRANSVTDLSDDVTNVTPIANQLPDPTNLGTAGGGGQSQPIPANDPNAAANQNNRTPVAFAPVRPEIGVTKQVTNIVDNGNGSFRVTYRQIVRNLSSTAIDLNNVRLVDQPLNSVYRVGSSNGAVSATYVPGSLRIGPNPGPAGYRGNPVINTVGFNGTDNGGTGLELLQTTGNTLAQGEYFVVDYDVTVVPGENLGDGPNDPPYEGQVRALGSNATITVTDLSDDVTNFPLEPLPPLEQLPRDLTGNGTATDSADGQGNPIPGPAGDSNSNNTPTANENNPTPVIFNRLTALIFKSITQVGNQAITAPLPPQVPGAPAGSVGVINVPSANPLVNSPALGELFNYTLYFRNPSTTQSVFNFEICDNLPPEVEFVNFVSANGTFLRELTDLPRPDGQGRSCTDLVTGVQLTQTGPSGAVLFNLGTLAPGQTGGVTFTVRRIR